MACFCSVSSYCPGWCCFRTSGPGRHRKAFQFAGEAVVITEDKSSVLRNIKGSTMLTRAIPRKANHGLLCGVIEPIATGWRAPVAEGRLLGRPCHVS